MIYLGTAFTLMFNFLDTFGVYRSENVVEKLDSDVVVSQIFVKSVLKCG